MQGHDDGSRGVDRVHGLHRRPRLPAGGRGGKGGAAVADSTLAGCRRVDVCPGEALSRSGGGVDHHAAPGRRSGLLSPLYPRRAASPRPSAHPSRTRRPEGMARPPGCSWRPVTSLRAEGLPMNRTRPTYRLLPVGPRKARADPCSPDAPGLRCCFAHLFEICMAFPGWPGLAEHSDQPPLCSPVNSLRSDCREG